MKRVCVYLVEKKNKYLRKPWNFSDAISPPPTHFKCTSRLRRLRHADRTRTVAVYIRTKTSVYTYAYIRGRYRRWWNFANRPFKHAVDDDEKKKERRRRRTEMENMKRWPVWCLLLLLLRPVFILPACRPDPSGSWQVYRGCTTASLLPVHTHPCARVRYTVCAKPVFVSAWRCRVAITISA